VVRLCERSPSQDTEVVLRDHPELWSGHHPSDDCDQGRSLPPGSEELQVHEGDAEAPAAHRRVKKEVQGRSTPGSGGTDEVVQGA